MVNNLNDILKENSQAAKKRVGEIHTFITNEVDANAELDFDSSSKTSEWNLWTEVVAFLSYIQEQLWGEAKDELEEIKKNGIAANKFFFAREWKNFQYGDDLVVDDTTGKYGYAVIDESKKIIKRLVILQANNGWSLKVATEDGSGNPIALTPIQLAAFQIYIARTQPAGPKINALSLQSDKIDIQMTVYYNPLKPLDSLQPLVEAAYLAYLAKIDIDGRSVYYTTNHIDEIQAVPNVTDVILTSAKAKIDGQSYATISRTYSPFSGYVELDPLLSIADLITYESE